MKHRPHLSTNTRDMLLGLAGAALVILLALIGQALAPPTASAHGIAAFDCAGYARTHQVVTGNRAAAVRARKACDRVAANHAHQHCAALTGPGDRAICAIRVVFGAHAADAVKVAKCESTANDNTPWPDHGTYAANGQYLGLFQMGSSERETYGHGSTARAQADAAFRYFEASGRDWSPWECQP